MIVRLFASAALRGEFEAADALIANAERAAGEALQKSMPGQQEAAGGGGGGGDEMLCAKQRD